LGYNFVMRIVSAEDCVRLRQEVTDPVSLVDAMGRIVGGAQLADGLWRVYSDGYPNGGVSKWNSDSSWKREWQLGPTQFYAFGEDLFGNQLIVMPDIENVRIWNHENGDLVDLLLDPLTLLETVVQSGIDWIDFYADGSPNVAKRKSVDVPVECHLHWTTPLILGGQVSPENTSVVERNMHLIGHAKLWAQLRDCDPGTIVVPNRKPRT
jgi:hypothetical protein